MNNIDDIRAALAELADEAPAPDGVRRRFVAHQRRHRQRRLVLRAAGAGVVAAGLGAGAYRYATRPAFPRIAGGPGGGWLEAPVRYRPAWLPSGFGEWMRTVVIDGERAAAVALQWQRPDADPVGDTIELLVGRDETWDGGVERGPSRPTEVNGVPAQLVEPAGDQQVTSLTWQPPGAPRLSVNVLDRRGPGWQQDAVRRVAGSVRPSDDTIAVGPRFGWVPADGPWMFNVRAERDSWVQSLGSTGDGPHVAVQFGPRLTARLDNSMLTEPVSVGDHDADFVVQGSQLFVTLADGTEVVFALEGDRPDPSARTVLLRAARAFEYGPWPDMSWVGQR